MALKTVLFLGLFLFSFIGGLFIPLWSVLGYMAIYVVGPEGQWWHRPLQQFGLRYSVMLVAAMAFGFLLNSKKMRFGNHLLTGHEKAILCFLAMLWVLRFMSPDTGFYTVVDHPTVKMVKVLIFCFLMSHIVTELKSLNLMILVLVGATFILGLQAYSAPPSAFYGGRLEGVGGSDFAESNVLPGFIGGVLPLMGALLLQKGAKIKAFAITAGVFAVNAIVLTRSRGAMVGLGLGSMAAALLAPKAYRKPIAICLVLAALGGLYLMDEGFKSRLTSLTYDSIQEESSAGGRLDTWKASLRLLADHPLGCGPGNFKQTIGNYDFRFAGRDAHSTVVRCWSELGIPGFLFFLFLVYNSIRLNSKAVSRAKALPEHLRSQILLPAYALSVGLITILAVGLFVTLLYNEFLWWWFLFPVCMHRVLDNLEEDEKMAGNNEVMVGG